MIQTTILIVGCYTKMIFLITFGIAFLLGYLMGNALGYDEGYEDRQNGL